MKFAFTLQQLVQTHAHYTIYIRELQNLPLVLVAGLCVVRVELVDRLCVVRVELQVLLG